MKLIKPAEISAKIMTLIDEAEKELIIVSPYNDITGWTKLINRIKKAQSNGVSISWYTRKNNVERRNSEEVRSIGIEPILIDDLHVKIYMNEEYAIFTSMNMSKVSDEKSIDLGYITTSKEEYDELFNAFLKHIKSKTNNNKGEDKVTTVSIKTPMKEVKSQSLNSNYVYINTIHEHTQMEYGSFKFTYKADEVLEYINFIKPGYRVSFIPFSQAIKVHIYLPSDDVFDDIENRVNNSIYEFSKLYKKSEFEFCRDDDGDYVKYYYELYNKKLINWGSNELIHFMKNLDIIIRWVFGNN